MKPQAQSSPQSSGMQQGPDALPELRAVMTFSTVLGVTTLLCSFSLVERKQVESYLIHQN